MNLRSSKVERILQTMTTSKTSTSQYNNSFNNTINNNAIQQGSYSNYLCGVYNQRILFETASTTTTSTTFANLTTKTVSSGSTKSNINLLLPQKAPMLQALPTLRSDLSLNDTGLFTVYHFIKNFIG